MRHDHTPDRKALILNRAGRSITGAKKGDYPLIGFCACGETIICRDGTADWDTADRSEITDRQWKRLTGRPR